MRATSPGQPRFLEKINVMLAIDDLTMGGAERQLVELARGLDKSRFRVDVVTLFPGRPLERELEGQPGIELSSLHRRGKFDFGILLKLARHLERRRIHIVQPYLTPAIFFALGAGLLARTPVKIVTERSGLRSETRFGENVYRFCEDRLTRFADAAIANSKAGEAFLRSRGVSPRKTGVIYNGVNPERVTVTGDEVARTRARLALKPGQPVVGVVASLTPAKDYPSFLRAALIIAEAVPETRFLIVGDGPLRGELEAETARLGLSDTVTFTGQDARVAPYLACFDVAVLPSKDYEGCSNFLLEAMGLGKAAVATDVGGNPELIEDGENGVLVPARDPARLADAVITLLRDPATRTRLAAAAQRRFQAGFSLQAMVQQYEALYERLLQRHGYVLRSEGAASEAPVREGVRPS